MSKKPELDCCPIAAEAYNPAVFTRTSVQREPTPGGQGSGCLAPRPEMPPIPAAALILNIAAAWGCVLLPRGGKHLVGSCIAQFGPFARFVRFGGGGGCCAAFDCITSEGAKPR
jgi:hypothetical protein